MFYVIISRAFRRTNEFDPKAAAWLRELIAAGHIPKGEVDERSIADVQPADLAGYVQCHFFAGIGGWPLALRLVGWPEDRPVWTGSCPCPPFSVAGKKKSCPKCGGSPIPHPRKTGVFACVPCGHEWFADERHLWPEFLRLIAERRPSIVFGEQVAGADGLVWLAGVRATLEGLGYDVGAADLCAASVTAPHIRQRLYWLADRTGAGSLLSPLAGIPGEAAGAGIRDGEPERCGGVDGLADADGEQTLSPDKGRFHPKSGSGDPTGGLADTQCDGERRIAGDCGGQEAETQRGKTQNAGADETRNGGSVLRLADRPGQRWDGQPDAAGPGGRPLAQDSHTTCRLGNAEIGAVGRRQRIPGGEGPLGGSGADCGLAHAHGGQSGDGELQRGGIDGQQPEDSGSGGLGDPHDTGSQGRGQHELSADQRAAGKAGVAGGLEHAEGDRREQGRAEPSGGSAAGRRGFDTWSSYCIIFCSDGKFRRVPLEPALFPLVDGFPGRVGLLRGSGNAIVPQVAARFIQAFMMAKTSGAS